MSDQGQLSFRKQFVLSQRGLELPKAVLYEVADFRLYCHEELKVSQGKLPGLDFYLVGDLFDAENTAYNNEDIVREVEKVTQTFEELLLAFDRYCGSFFVIVHGLKDQELTVFTDATSQREVFYAPLPDSGDLVLASQPALFSELFSFKKVDDPVAAQFFASEAFVKKRAFVGDLTNLDQVKRLKPNFWLNLRSGQVNRHFPTVSLPKADMEKVAVEAAALLKGFIQAASERFDLVIPVSGGWESRVLLAASQPIQSKVNYFVLKHPGYSESHPDISTPNRLLQRLGLKLNITEYATELDEGFMSAVARWVSFPRNRTFHYLLNGLAPQWQHYMMLNGNVSEIARMEWDDLKVKNGKVMAHMERYPNQVYAERYYDQWLVENKADFERLGYSVADMLYWEENCPNWVAKTNTETRLVEEILQPFNSRKLLTLLLSVDKKYRNKQNPILYARIIDHLWADCLSEPVNTGLKKKLIKAMQKMGVYGFYRNLSMDIKILLKK